MKICFITAIYGGYEQSCKRFVPQTVNTDFICFTDNPNINNNGWIIDTTPHHLVHKSSVDNDSYKNSITKNNHTFNVAKYYKQSFRHIPVLQKYDVVVWVDGTIEIVYDKTSEYILGKIGTEKIIGWHHEMRWGALQREVEASNFDRYTSTFWNNQSQPYQDVNHQFESYTNEGYNDAYFQDMQHHSPHFGVWITCFVAFLNHDENVERFLDLWYLQTLQYTTQDQIGFPFVCQKLKMTPFTLPNAQIQGDRPHSNTQFYIKHNHGM